MSRIHQILVVDDNPTNLKLISLVLEFEGHVIFQATDAESAQEIIKTHPLDLVLMDIAMPGMDGLSLTRLLKGADATKDLMIVALTASAMRGDEARVREAGCDGYITKPIETRQFPSIILGYLEQNGAPAKP
jgi:CheY-like chemotaxis protein